MPATFPWGDYLKEYQGGNKCPILTVARRVQGGVGGFKTVICQDFVGGVGNANRVYALRSVRGGVGNIHELITLKNTSIAEGVGDIADPERISEAEWVKRALAEI